MNSYSRLIVSLAVVSAIAAGLLALTFRTTAPVIAEREREDREKALQNVFFLQIEGQGKDRDFKLDPKEIAPGVTALYLPNQDGEPVYYAAAGQATGYNSAVPVTLMVGFTGPAADAASLLQGYVEPSRMPAAGQKGEYIVGFSVVNSEETPGLGEKIKDTRAPYTWVQYFRGTVPPPNPDSATDFQKQFRGRLADSLLLKKNGGDLDAITASTITSNGVLAAIRDASSKLDVALASRQ